MDVLRNNEEQVMCPYNPAHYIRKCRLDVHLKKCRKSYKSSEVMVICDFNAAHRIPEPELQYHHDICPDRKTVELHVFTEEKFAPETAAVLPPIPVPVDGTWDDEEVQSYNPQAYCERNHILRRIDTESAAIRRDFRIAERHRIENLGPAKDPTVGADSARGGATQTARRAGNVQNLPPIPGLSRTNFETAPPEVTAMMEKVSMFPKAAVIPKQK